ncbi:Putative organic solute transporter subunit alpha/Transmembrane protein [Septoria linicola]|uniref:Organic solute transporter subunit alpha/Transmembrane protein n=1 Tax=Septoria linicola TaxID=215465 RepID=A0A9Q9APY2_9PEZI|nr:Putative organic solute transporter subunit alpha/Transmembrane protein [Septoria linicola]
MAAWEEMSIMVGGQQNEEGGTGSGFARGVIIVAGVCALVSTLLTIIIILLQAKNYRKPLLQRHVVRIVVLVPIFAGASWASLTSLRVAFWIDPFRDVYEGFVIYTFFQLLINFLGGERSLIIMMHGRPPVQHLWPLNHVLAKIDISDPHSFLQVKRGILQYVWIKPALAVTTVVCKATGTFREGILAANSGYFWTGLVYNISICWSLYALALFWVCMSQDLQPFRPMPKFLCIKGIIFASWWQGFFLSILVALGVIPSVGESYTADNLAAAIQDALICFEMPFFALAQWWAFSWKDYADQTISDARMPIRYALRDAFGPRDLIEDFKETFSGKKYDYRNFDANDNVMAHEESSSREARMREGMRYERDGRGKYWVPAPNEARQPLLQKYNPSHARTMSPGQSKDRSTSRSSKGRGYGATNEVEETEMDPEEERLYTNARALEFGDWNYPVINTHYATREDRLYADPNTISQTTNRAILQPGKEQRQRRKSKIAHLKHKVHQHDRPESSGSGGGSSKGKGKAKETLENLPVVGKLVRNESSHSTASHSSQLVDLVVEDHDAEEIERVRARKEGGPGWNSVEQKHFVKTFPDEDEAESVRHGFNPDQPEQEITDQNHTLDDPFAVGDDEDRFQPLSKRSGKDEVGDEQPWEERDYGKDGAADNGDRWFGKGDTDDKGKLKPADQRSKGSNKSSPLPSPLFEEERNAWGDSK